MKSLIKFRTAVYFNQNSSRYNGGKAYISEEFNSLDEAEYQLIRYSTDTDKSDIAKYNLSYFSEKTIKELKDNDNCRFQRHENGKYIDTEVAGIYEGVNDFCSLAWAHGDNVIDCGDFYIKIEQVQ